MKSYNHKYFRLAYVLLVLNFTLMMPMLAGGIVQHDDYNFFDLNSNFFFLRHPQAIFTYFFGRPLQGIIANSFTYLYPIIGIVGLKIIGVICSTLIGCYIFAKSESSGLSQSLALCAAIVFSVLPGFIFSELLIIAIPFYIAIYFGLLAHSLSERAEKSKAYWLATVVAILLSLFTYQPSSVMFFLFPFLKIIDSGRIFTSKNLTMAAAYGVAVIGYVFILKIGSEPYLIKKFPEAAHIVTSESSPYRTILNYSLISVLQRLRAVYQVYAMNFFPTTPIFNVLGWIFPMVIIIFFIATKGLMRGIFGGFFYLALAPLIFCGPVIFVQNGLIFYRTTTYMTFAIIMSALIAFSRLAVRQQHFFLNFSVVSLTAIFLSSINMIAGSAIFNHGEYVKFKNDISANKMYIPDYSKTLFDEFYLPVTGQELGKIRRESENSVK
jgi:hypothetical protein